MMEHEWFLLEAPDASSPRATYENFIEFTDELYKLMRASEEDSRKIERVMLLASRCFDLSHIAPNLVPQKGVESVLLLREILDRVPVPPVEEMPDKALVLEKGVIAWTIPHTEITIGRVPQGPRKGAYLFTPYTVDQLERVFEVVRDLPYKPDAKEDFFYEYVYASGWMIPEGVLNNLPSYFQEEVLDQMVWRWAVLGVLLIISMALTFGMKVLSARLLSRRKSAGSVIRLLMPLYLMGLLLLLVHLVDVEINMRGTVLMYLKSAFMVCFFVVAAWGILVASSVVIRKILTSKHIREEALDADLIKLVGRLIAFTLIFVLFYFAGDYFGLSVTAVFASAGIAGMAMALAARESLANFFGGISIFMDRPFRAGDYIVMDNGDRGMVQAVGMRSTKLVSRDNCQITIPNSVITSVKIVNQSAPEPHFRIRIPIGVAYGSDLDKVESVLLEVAKGGRFVISDSEPRVRFRRFGDFALQYELLCWVQRPEDRGKQTHELNREIYKRFAEEGIVIPFPQSEVLLRNFAATDQDGCKSVSSEKKVDFLEE